MRSCSSPFSLEIGALINAFVFALGDSEFRGHAPVAARFEIPDLQLARVNDRQCRRLDAADRSDVARARTEHAFRDRARAVDPDEPVALAAGTSGVRQPRHFRTVTQMLEAVTNGLRRHRLQPEAFDRVLVLGEPAKVVENQLAFAAGVASVDELLAMSLRAMSFFRYAEAIL